MATINKIKLPGESDAHKLVDSGAIRYDGSQVLTDNQKAQARANIGVVSNDVVRVSVSIPEDNTSVIDIPISIQDTNNLTVYMNGLLLTPVINYTATTSAITLQNYVANAGDIFTFTGSIVFGTSINPEASNVLVNKTGFYASCNNLQEALDYIATQLQQLS